MYLNGLLSDTDTYIARGNCLGECDAVFDYYVYL